MHYRFDRAHLRDLGFRGFRSLSTAVDAADVPRSSGVYVVLLDPPIRAFLEQSVGGHFKGKDPTVAIETLEAKWVSDSPTMYIGRAGNLNSRIKLLARYGRGEPVAHQGGRYLWQLTDYVRLQVAWLLAADPVSAEATLLEDFENVLGQLPFANLVRGAQPVAFA
jgi:hypothetical protein